MIALTYVMFSLAITCLIGAFIAFGAVVKKDKDEAILSLSDAGTVFAFVTRATGGWQRSSLGRSLCVVGAIALVSGIILMFAAS